MIAFVTLSAALAAPARPPLRFDLHGDPLPPGAVARLGSVRFRHPGAVHSVAFSPDGRRLAAWSDDKAMIVVWDRATGRKVCESPVAGRYLPGALTFSADGKRVYAAFPAADPTAEWAWNATTGAPADLPAPPAGTRLLSFPPGGREMFLLFREKELVRWDIEKGVQVGRGTVPTRSPVAARFGDRLLFAGQSAESLTVWDAARPDPLWSVAAAREKSFGPPPPAFSADGALVAATPQPRAVVVYDAPTGQVVRVPAADGEKSYWSLAFSPDRQTLAGSNWDGSVRLWSVADGRERARVRVVPGTTTHAYFAPDGKTFATGGPNNSHGVLFWDTATGRPVEPFPGHASPVSSAAFSPDGRLVATSSWVRGDPVVRLWEPDTGRLVRTLDSAVPAGVSAVAFSPDGRTLAAASWNSDNKVRLWDVATGALRHMMAGHEAGATCVAFSADGKRVVTGDGFVPPNQPTAGRVCVWDTDTGRLLREIRGARGIVRRVAFTPDGTQVLAAAEGVSVFDAETGRAAGEPFAEGKRLWGLTASPDGSRLATTDENGRLRVWDFATRRAVAFTSPEGMSIDAVFAADGRSLAVIRGDGGGVLLGVPSGEVVGRWEGVPGDRHVAVSPDGRRLATAGNDESSAVIWDAAATWLRR